MNKKGPSCFHFYLFFFLLFIIYYKTMVSGTLIKSNYEVPLQMLKNIWQNTQLFPTGTSNKKKAVALTLGATVALVCRLVFTFCYVPRNLRHLPTVSWLRLFLSILKLEDATQRAKYVYGPAMKKGNGVYLINFPITWTVFVSEPKAAKAILMKTDNFPKSRAVFDALGKNSAVSKFFGNESVAVVNGEKWKNQRKVMNPAFHRAMPVKLFGRLMQKGFAIIDKQPDHEVGALDFFQRLTLDALGNAGFGFDFGSLEDPNSVWTTTYETVRIGLRSPWTFMFPRLEWLFRRIIPARKRMADSVDKLNGLLLEMIQKRRLAVQSPDYDASGPEHEKDLLTLMLEAEMRGEGFTTNEQLRSNIAVFFLAGHETTANTMSFCLYNLAMNKEVQEKARQEVIKVLGDDPVDVLPSIEELRQIPYLDMVLKENLRRYGPAAMTITRKAVEDFDMNGTFIPKGTSVVVEMNALHHNPEVWKNPEHFDPERFAPGNEHDVSHEGMTWIPFSSGSRGCIGQNFSMHEQRVFLTMLLRKYEWELPEDSIHRNGVKIGNFQNAAPQSLRIKFHPRY
ncbi:cytochrome P450 [Halteromyces radiatus]|uniref:cytochrome P450 n=1 Tax=Halteromyces radiatus TaxID=101107 RepID=UPI00221FB320|nr:cytochrome P450 [Halteromyces radiatus]KAI8090035.1 cytochrome P450 [Halteromyces radiatus]